MGAVSAALSAIPDNVVKMPSSIAEAFLLIDPALSILNRQLLDARGHLAQIAKMFGDADPMMDALHAQITALEDAYAMRLAALKRRREESERGLKHADTGKKVYKLEVENLSGVRGQTETQSRNSDALWLWVFLALLAHQASMKKSGPRLDAA